MELGVSKEKLTAFQVKAAADRKAMEEEFDSSSDVIFNYGYGCCAFAHDICGSCDTPKPGGPVDHRQPAETCVSHIMRPIHE